MTTLDPVVEPQSPEDSDGKVEFRPGHRVWLIFGTLSILTMMVALDGTSISVGLPIIAQDLEMSAVEAFWSGTSFLLLSTVFQPSFASLSNIFGRRSMILTALVFFLVGSIVASVAKNATYMLVGRSLQGLGGGGVIALTEIVVTDIVPLRLRGQYFGILSAMWSIGSVTGPILGGGFSQNVTWRWIFYINFPFIGLGAAFLFLFFKLNFIPSSLRDKLRRIDYIGTVLFIGSMASFLIPLTWGGVMYPWDSWRTLVPLLAGVAGLIAFAAYEALWIKNGDAIIPTAIFATRTAVVSYAGTVLHGLTLWCALYYMPLYFEAVKGYTPIVAGVSLFPDTFTVAPSAMIIGFLVTKTGRYRWAIWLGWLLSTLGMGLLCLLDVDTSIPAWIFLLLVSGLGLGILFPSMAFAIQASAKPEHLATAVAMFSFFRAFGQTLGVAIGGVIFQNQMRSHLQTYPSLAPMAETYSRDAAALVQLIKAMPASADKHDLQQAYTDSLRIVWAVCCALVGVGGLLSLWTKEYSLDAALTGDQGIAREKTKEQA